MNRAERRRQERDRASSKRVYIHEGEVFPVYVATSDDRMGPNERPSVVPVSVLTRCQAAQTEWEACQEILRGLHRAAAPGEKP